MADWLKAAIGGAVGGFFVLIAAVATGWFGYASKDEELRVHLVEIAIGILRADPSKEDVAPTRGWAMDAIDKDSGLRPFTADERAALLHKPLGGEWSPAMGGRADARARGHRSIELAERLDALTKPTFGFPQSMQPWFPALHNGGTTVNGVSAPLSPFGVEKGDKIF